MASRIGFIGPAATGFRIGATPTAQDIEDLVDIELWATYRPLDAFDHLGPMLTIFMACLGAFPEEMVEARQKDWPADGADSIVLRSSYGVREVPVIGFARRILTIGAAAMRTVAKCDRLMVNSDGAPLTATAIVQRFARLGRRIGIDDYGLPARLRLAFRNWIRESHDPHVIALLCRQQRRIAAFEQQGLRPPTQARLRKAIETFHPLGQVTRPMLRRPGALARAEPDRAFRALSQTALADAAAVRQDPRRFCFPVELIEAVAAAWDCGRQVNEIAGYYNIQPVLIRCWIRCRNDGQDPRQLTKPLMVASNAAFMLAHMRRHPTKTLKEVQHWAKAHHQLNLSNSQLRRFAKKHHHRFAKEDGPRKRKRSARSQQRCKALHAYLRRHPQARVSEAQLFIKARFGVRAASDTLKQQAAEIGFHFAPRQGPETEPARSLLLSYMATNPGKTQSQIVRWLKDRHGIEIQRSALGFFIKRHGLRPPGARNKARAATAPAVPVKRKRRQRRGPETEPYRSAIIAYVKANPQAAPFEVRSWIAREHKLEVARCTFRRFLKRHGLQLAAPFRAFSTGEALILRDYMRCNPQSTIPETREWISARLQRRFSNNDLRNFAKSHDLAFAQSGAKIDIEPARSRLLGHCRVGPQHTIDDVRAWLRAHLHIEVSETGLKHFAARYGLTFAPRKVLGCQRHRRALENWLATHPSVTVHETQAWFKRKFNITLAPKALSVFAARRGHSFAPTWIGPDTEPYRSALLKWIDSQANATAPRARAFMFKRFGLNMQVRRLQRFALRHGRKFESGRSDPLPAGAAKRLERQIHLTAFGKVRNRALMRLA